MALTRIRAQQISNIDIKQAVRVVTTSNITLSGGAPRIVDEVTLAVGNRVLVNGQTDATQNGIYQVQSVGSNVASDGTWVRSTDANVTGEMASGLVVTVSEGYAFKDTLWTLTTDDPVLIGESVISFQQSTSFSFGVINTGGTTILANTVGDTFTFSAGNNIAITGNANSKTVTIGVTGIETSEISNGTSTVAIATANGNVTVSVAGTANVLTVSSAGTVVFGTQSVTGNITAGNLSGTNIIGSLTTAAQPNVTSLGSLTSLSVSGNITGGNITTSGTISVGGIVISGNTIVGQGPTLTIDPNGSGGTDGNVVITGNLTVNGTTTTINSNTITTNDLQINMANNAATATAASNGGIGVGPVGTEYATFLYNSESNVWVASLGISSVGNITAGNISGASIAGVLSTAAQTNITSVGTLTLASVSGNVQGGNLQTVGLISATGNIAGNFFLGNGSQLTGIVAGGGIGWTTQANTAPESAVAGDFWYDSYTDKKYQYYDDGVGDFWVDQSFPTSFSSLAVTGNIVAGNVLLTGNIVGNISAQTITANVVGDLTGTVLTAAQPVITSVGTLSSLSVTGNMQAGHVNTAGSISADGNITGSYILGNGSQLTGVDATQIVSGTSNVKVTSSGGNIAVGIGGTADVAVFAATGAFVTGGISATGSITAGNISTTGVISGNAAAASNLVFGNITTLNTAGITTDELYLQATTRLDVTASGASGYVFDQYGGGLNPTIYTRSGDTLAFNLAVPGHPFLIRLNGANYSTGLNHVTTAGVVTTGASAQGQVSGTLYWKIPYGITGNYQYQCSVHSGMLGTITIADSNVANVAVSSAATVTTAAQTNITSVGTLTSLAVTGNISSGNLSVSTGTITGGNIVNANANGVGNIGSSTTFFNTVFAKATSAQYADLAEMYLADHDYKPGTVLVFGGLNEVTVSNIDHDPRAAGVVSTQPSYLMNSGLSGKYPVELALTGRVPCCVQGPVEKGDRLVNVAPGMAGKLNLDKYQVGCVIGKSLEVIANTSIQTIEIAIGRY